MDYTNITERLKRVAAIVDSWQRSGDAPQIERDIALEELRAIYNDLLIIETADNHIEPVVAIVDAVVQKSVDAPVVEQEVVEEQKPVEEPRADVEDAVEEDDKRDPFYDALDIDALLGLTSESQPVADDVDEQEVEDVAEPEPEPEPEVESVQEPEPAVVAEPEVDVAKSLSGGLFDLNDIPVRSKSKRKMISLYSDNPAPTAAVIEPEVKAETPKTETPKKEEVKIEPRPIEPVQRLGDSFAGIKTLAEQMTQDDAPTTPFNRIKDLRSAIGLNDKFLMIRDLFGGDAERYEATIDTLDEFEDLDECIIYIVENFRWNPDLEASKLLISLIERKLA